MVAVFRRARGETRRGTRWLTTLLRALVTALLLPLATAGALPSWALLAEVEAAHVCHCSLEKHDCVCAKCNPEQEEMLLSSESLTGRCGDDDVAFPGKLLVAVLPPSGVLAPIVVRVSGDAAVPHPPESPSRAPPTPPPRRRSSAA